MRPSLTQLIRQYALIFFTIAYSSFHVSGQTIRDLTLFMGADKETICKGQIATITINNSYVPGQAGTYDLWTENLRTESYNGSGVGCTILKENTADIGGDGVVSTQYIRRRCGEGENQPIINTIIIKVMPTQSTTYSVSFDGEWRIGADPVLHTQETVVERRSYHGTVLINVARDEPPVLAPGKVELNQNDNVQLITAQGVFFSNDRKMTWYQTECSSNTPVVQGTYTIYAPETKSQYGYNTSKLGSFMVMAQQIDNGCISKPSEPVEITVKPCHTNNYGCGEKEIAFIDSLSCTPEAAARGDHHFYHHEKLLCTGCDLQTIWEKYKGDVNNQAIIMSDAIPMFEAAKGKIRMGFMSSLFPKKIPPTKGITDCMQVDLPRFSTAAIEWGLIAGARLPPVFNVAGGLALVQEACALEPTSKTDPIFIRVDEGAKCVTNYTMPGHILYPGKVTRCLVKECNEVKLMTFGEGSTLFPDNVCGTLFLKNANQYIGDWMFKNVDERFANSLKAEGFRIPTHVAITAQQRNFNKSWKVKDLKIKYDGSDSLFGFYRYNDSTNFLSLRNMQVDLAANGEYTGTDVDGQPTQGTWAYDSVNHSFTTDTSVLDMVGVSEHEFTIRGRAPIFINGVPSSTEYQMTFYDLLALPVTFGYIGADPENCTVKVMFEVANQVNNRVFEIQRSMDGIGQWKTQGTVPGEQMMATSKAYSFTDYAPLHGKNYYRIKQVDVDGKVSYSPVCVANNSCATPAIINYPNPFGSSLTLINLPLGGVNIRLVNGLGQTAAAVFSSQSTVTLSTKQLKPGLYFIQVMKNNVTIFKASGIKID